MKPTRLPRRKTDIEIHNLRERGAAAHDARGGYLRHRCSRIFGFGVLPALLLIASAGNAQSTGDGPVAGIEPMTTVAGDRAGYLADPQPIRRAPSVGDRVQLLSGTTQAVISCAYPIKPGCFAWTPVKVTLGSLKAQLDVAGVRKTNFQNLDIFQDDHGGWQAALTIGVQSAGHPKHWTVITHAHPVDAGTADTPPTNWEADAVLIGSFSKPVTGNYDGKYFEDDGRLYLLYVDSIVSPPALRNAIFLQPMQSFTQLASSPRVMVLRTGDREGELASETYANTRAKLVEAPYISKVAGKYALVYSSGAYLTPGYKAGVAWSDTLLPAHGQFYRKVLQVDEQGLWGAPGHREVRYLVQSEKLRWPHFAGTRVIGPGVAAAIQGPEGAWWLYFNGFAPVDMPQGQKGQVEGDHRRPYYLHLRVQVPAGASVSSVTDAELARWMEPNTQ